MKKKLIKTIITTLLCITTICTITACGENKTQTTSSSNTKDTENETESSPLATFAQALSDEDYQTILDMLYLPENSIVSADNIHEFLERSNLKDFLGAEQITSEVTDTTDTQILGTISIGDKENDTCPIIFNRNKDNNYVLEMSEAYQERDVIAPGDASIRINGIRLDEESASTTGQEHGLVTYTLICPVTNFEANVSTAITDYTIEVEWNKDTDKPYSIVAHEIDEETLNNVCESIKTNLNNMFTDIANKTDIDSYLSEDADPNFKKNLENWYQKQDLETAPVITILEPSSETDIEDEDNRDSIWTNNTIHICTQIENTWTQGEESKATHLFAQFDLELEQGTYKLINTTLIDTGTAFTNSFRYEW